LSLAKFLLIVAREDHPSLDIHDIPAFFTHLLERVDWRRDLHFHTCTTIDTLDYTGSGLNEGSKVVIAAAGPKRRTLPTEIPKGTLPDSLQNPRIVIPGVLAIEGPRFTPQGEDGASRLGNALPTNHPLNTFPLCVIVDDSDFASRSLDNWLWVTFTRSNPATDIHGVGEFVRNKHWGCEGALMIDARVKPHHAPPLEVDSSVERRVDALGAPGGPLHGII
jgi:4-hydroxy-3-polyprenylbenzoate decarboxylase